VHKIVLSGLSSNTEYFFRVKSAGSGIVTSEVLSFTFQQATTPPPSPPPPPSGTNETSQPSPSPSTQPPSSQPILNFYQVVAIVVIMTGVVIWNFRKKRKR